MDFDFWLFQQINNLAGHWAALDWLGIFFAVYAQYVVGAGLLIFWFWGKSREESRKNLAAAGAALGAVVLSRLVLTEIIRWVWFRPRPFVDHAVNLLISHDNAGSFPSGHAAFFFALAMAFYLCDRAIFPESFDKLRVNWSRRVAVCLFLAAILISLARVFVGVHYPSDILVGALVGALGGWLVVQLYVKIVSIKNNL